MHMRLGIETVGAISRLILFSAIIASCGQANKADVASNSHDLEQAIANGNYDSLSLGLGFRYPEEWVIDEAEGTIYLASSQELLPWGMEYFSSTREPYYKLYEVSPYSSRFDRFLGRERSVEEIAEGIVHTFEVGPVKGALIEPISSFKIGGYDAVRLLIGAHGLADYLVLVALKPNQVIAVSTNGPVERINEMRVIVDDIANSLRPVQ